MSEALQGDTGISRADFGELLIRIIESFSPLEAMMDSLFVRTTPTYQVFVLCNDAFHWATADLEEITVENIQVFEQALADCRANGYVEETDGPLLFCARVRGMRPQGAMYKYIEKVNWPMFNAAGPERKTDNEPFGNPEDIPTS